MCWKNLKRGKNMNELVSIYMLSYNHAKWIDRAIQGIVNQKTNFSYKLYIYDDASTDGSRDIIEKWKQHYPDIIIPILQERNIYSQFGFGKINSIISEYIKGKYVCLCEGDDYWIDENKIQKQVEYMEMNPKCSFCFTNAYMVNIDNKIMGGFFDRYFWKDKCIIKKLKRNSDFSLSEILKIGFTPTASGMINREAYKKFIQFPYQIDLAMRLIATKEGYAHYFNEKMTAYRIGNADSASGRASENFEKYKEEFCEYHKKIYKELNIVTNYKYKSIINQVIDREYVLAYVRFLGELNYKDFISLNRYKELRMYRKIKYFLKALIKRKR